MASHPLCISCRSFVQTWLCHPMQIQANPAKHVLLRSHRPFSTVRRNAAAAASPPAPYQAKKVANTNKNTTSQPPLPSPKSTRIQDDQGSSFDPTLGMAATMREKLPTFTETYVAYASCENFVKECARQAPYSVPKPADEDAEIPRTKDGAMLGVGEGWWYESKS